MIAKLKSSIHIQNLFVNKRTSWLFVVFLFGFLSCERAGAPVNFYDFISRRAYTMKCPTIFNKEDLDQVPDVVMSMDTCTCDDVLTTALEGTDLGYHRLPDDAYRIFRRGDQYRRLWGTVSERTTHAPLKGITFKSNSGVEVSSNYKGVVIFDFPKSDRDVQVFVAGEYRGRYDMSKVDLQQIELTFDEITMNISAPLEDRETTGFDPAHNLKKGQIIYTSGAAYKRIAILNILHTIDSLPNFGISNIPTSILGRNKLLIKPGTHTVAELLQILMDSTEMGLAYYGRAMQKLKDSTESNWTYPGKELKKPMRMYIADEATMVRFRGKVLKSETREPIPYAEIFNECGWGTLADSEGNFILDMDCSSPIWFVGKDRRMSVEMSNFNGSVGGTVERTVLISKVDGKDALE